MWTSVLTQTFTGWRIREALAVVVAEVKGLLEMLGRAEPQPVLVDLQRSLQGTDLTAPETA